MEYVELCNLKFSSVRQVCPDWTVFLVFMLRRPTMLSTCRVYRKVAEVFDSI